MSYGGAQRVYQSNQDCLSLSQNDRSILLYHTMKYTASLSSCFISYTVGLLNCPSYYDTVSLITHSKCNQGIAKRLDNHLNFDMMIMKLFLVTLSFSTISYTFYFASHPMNLSYLKQVLSMQNQYIEVTWKCLVSKNGYKQAILCFSNFIICVFALNEAIIASSDVQWYTQRMDSLTEQTKQTLTLSN